MIWLPVVGSYADIDVYASIIAYADLLNQRGKSAKTYIPFAPNYSVPQDLRMPEWENPTFDFQPEDEAIILDVSVPTAINRFVPNNQILEIIDHHPGYEAYWHERIGDKAIIEKIGAVATSIFEWWGECWDYNKMSPQIAKLLLGAILDNTLNFTAKVTTERDHKAAAKLAEIADTTVQDFTAWYFSAVSQTIITDLKHSLLNDCKIIESPLDGTSLAFAQLTLWDTQEITTQHDRIAQIMSQNHKAWLVSIICTAFLRTRIILSRTLPNSTVTSLAYYASRPKAMTKGDWLVSDQLHLRKEIIGKMLTNLV